MNEIALLISTVIVCIGLDIYWYRLVRERNRCIFTAFSHLVSIEACLYLMAVVIAVDKISSALIIVAILSFVTFSTIVLGKKCDRLSDEAVTLNSLLPKEEQWAEDSEIIRCRITISSALWLTFLLGTMSVYPLTIMANSELLHIFANSTIFINFGLLFSLFYSYCHNETSIARRAILAMTQYQPQETRVYNFSGP